MYRDTFEYDSCVRFPFIPVNEIHFTCTIPAHPFSCLDTHCVLGVYSSSWVVYCSNVT
jgi:hypothetical protein